ncbi:MAG: four helix bundle protein [Alloprevotella sp.]|nr:four helix bundle protein [Alloprevotella sp.]
MNRDNQIAQISKAFALRIIKLYQFLRNEEREFTISKQILRSGTSIGANVRESVYAQSRADFISKMSIALKEASETEYWLEVLNESGYIEDKAFKSIYDDNNKITATLINIIKSSKKEGTKE